MAHEICDYHSKMKGHNTETCGSLGSKIHQLIEAKVINWIDLLPKEYQSEHVEVYLNQFVKKACAIQVQVF